MTTEHFAVARSLGAVITRLEGFDFEPRALACVSAKLARIYHVVPLMFHDEHLVVAMDNLLDTEAINALQFISQRSIEPVFAARDDISRAINNCYDTQEQERELDQLQLSDSYHEDDQAMWKEAERLANETPSSSWSTASFSTRCTSALPTSTSARAATAWRCSTSSTAP